MRIITVTILIACLSTLSDGRLIAQTIDGSDTGSGSDSSEFVTSGLFGADYSSFVMGTIGQQRKTHTHPTTNIDRWINV